MKSLHLTNAFHETSGGVRTTYLALLRQAERERRAVSLVVPGEADSVERVGEYGVIHRVRAPRAPAFDRRYRVIPPHRYLWPPFGRLWQILEAERPDVVEIADKYSLCYFAGLLRRRRAAGPGPTLIGASWERMEDNLRAFVMDRPLAAGIARQYLGRLYVGLFDAHVTNSTYTADELRGAMRPPHVRPVYVAPPGVDCPPALSADERNAARVRLFRRCGLPLDAILLLYAGRVSPEKNVAVLIEAMADVNRIFPSAHLVIMGDGPSRARLERAARGCAAGHVRFHPHVTDRTELLASVAAADLFVHPNPREPFGIGPLEAMAGGVPVVVPAAGGVLTYASTANAWLSPAADAAALAATIGTALAHPAEGARRALEGRRTAERFAWPLRATRMLELYAAIHAGTLRSRHSRTCQGRRPRTPALRSPSTIAGSH